MSYTGIHGPPAKCALLVSTFWIRHYVEMISVHDLSFHRPASARSMDQKSKTFLDAEQEIEKLRFETLNLFDNYNRKCRKHELKMEKEKCYPQLHHSE